MLSELSGFSFHQISKRGSRSGRVLSTHWKRSPESRKVESFPGLHRFYFKLYSKFFALFWTWLVSGLSATWYRCLHALPCQHSPRLYSQNLISLSEPPCVKDPFGTTWLFPSACSVSLNILSGKNQVLTTDKYLSQTWLILKWEAPPHGAAGLWPDQVWVPASQNKKEMVSFELHHVMESAIT